MALESTFKTKLIQQLKRQYPGAIILKNDANFMQGIPDHLILYGKNWAAFEAKRQRRSSHRPNQDFYVDYMNDMSYASFVYPENVEVFLDELRKTLRP